MPAKVSYPGVYVQEEPSGARAVVAASTSTALFVGMVDRGPFGIPTRVLSLVEYERNFGADSSGEMADQVRQFYVNGGSEAWIMRIAHNAQYASVLLRNEANTAGGTLKLIALEPGVAGNLIRAEVDYDTASPERSFNLTLYRLSLRSDGTFDKKETETHANLSMDPGSARYVLNIVNGASSLVRVEDPSPAGAVSGMSVGGAVHATGAPGNTSVNNAFKPVNGAFRIAIGNRPPVDVVVPFNATPASIFGDIGTAIGNAYLAQGISVSATAVLKSFGGAQVLQISSPDGAVVITPATLNDVTVKLGLGVAAGGIEVDTTSPDRPAPTGLTSVLGPMSPVPIDTPTWLTALSAFAANTRSQMVRFTLADALSSYQTPVPPPDLLTGVQADAIHADAAPPAGSPIGSLANVRRALDEIAAALGVLVPSRWSVRRSGLRLAFTPKFGGSNDGLTASLANTSLDLSAAGRILETARIENVAAYSVGRQTATVPLVGKQENASTDMGSNGTDPGIAEYQAAFNTVESELDSFNLMVLPRTETQTDGDRKNLWGIASATAAKRRAILLVDPDSTWNSIASAESGVAALKIGVETRNAAIFWPRVKIPDATITAGKTVDPSGSIAGLMARNDTAKGVWTAAAGIEATIRGIVGVDRNMSDEENGVLNPKALNAIRLFPSGAVAWGARTMIGSDDTGNIDDKYIPVRRTMLFIEESLYRGLKFAVFQPNAEPLWASIRLAAGSFMNGLMRQGAFASRNKLEAYFVMCDATTTTPTDQNLGIVNVIVGFAPLKPAEFVVLTVKQIAGQAAV